MWDEHLREHVLDSLVVQRRAPHSDFLQEAGHSFLLLHSQPDPEM